MTRRTFVASTGAAAAAPSLSAPQIAARHAIVRRLPTPNFFEGMLLGNGDIGVCLVVRPDALGLHLGKEDAWDIRVSDEHIQHLRPFAEILEMWRRASERFPGATGLEGKDPELMEYTKKMRASYARPWPRPWPCGTVWVHWDARFVHVVEQKLDIATGIYTLKLNNGGLTCFVNAGTGHVHVSGDLPALSVAYMPMVDRETGLPAPELAASGNTFECYQDFPAEPASSSFALCGRLAGEWRAAIEERRARVLLTPARQQPLRLDLTLFTPRDRPNNREHARREAARLSATEAREETAAWWSDFWSRSAVEIADRELERTWYHNQYWLACCLRPGKVAPGLFGNWSTGKIGTAWHGDYHMNYNTQQVWWGVFSSNHVEQHLPYVELVEKLMPMAERSAREQFGLPGAYFPHSAYPVPGSVNPYPVPPWGYEICETPWTVQSLWWHYRYTLDREYLRRAYVPLRAAAEFLAAYLKREQDGKYHVVPTVSPENWGFTSGFRLNRDCIIDLTLSRFLFHAVVEAGKVLGADSGPRERWAEIARNLAPYPNDGEVWLDVADAPSGHVYNVPVTLAPVFPGDEVGLHSPPALLEFARRTARLVRLEGGNDLVWQPLARARLGMLDLEWFKREVAYCLLPNGVANDRVRQTGGRYRDETDFDFMMRMGVWTENLSLPAVLNECMLQSYNGAIRLFPNTRNLGPARFENLRATGAFLVSASWDGGAVRDVRIFSEKGGTARVYWNGAVREIPAKAGSTYSL
ncbi:MAG: hypothetical protein ACE15B_23790 [Bryobacteraceae bacterium]